MMNKKVLVIDDEPEIREIIQISLEDFAGLLVTTTVSANAFRAWESGRWDAILVDLDLGIPQGEHLAQHLQRLSIEFDVPVIYLTSRVMPNEVAQYAQFKPAGILAKPFDPQQLGYEVAWLAGWSSAKKMDRGSIAYAPPITQLSVIGIGFS
jgi:CheY-like chemotaxis protein